MSARWYYTLGSQQHGPVTFEQLEELAENGRLDRFTSMVWEEGMADWQPARTIEGLFKGPPPPPLARPSESSLANQSPPRPGWGLAATLAIFLGLLPASILAMGGCILMGEYQDEKRHRQYYLRSRLRNQIRQLENKNRFGKRLNPAQQQQLLQLQTQERKAYARYRSHRFKSEISYALAVCFTLLTFAIGTVVLVLFTIWMHRAWLSIPTPHRPFTPAQATGFLFLPCFNLYWIFQAIPGLSQILGQVLRTRNPGTEPRTGYSVGLAACITAIIPCTTLVIAPVLLALWVVMANRARNQLLAATQPEKPTFSSPHQQRKPPGSPTPDQHLPFVYSPVYHPPHAALHQDQLPREDRE